MDIYSSLSSGNEYQPIISIGMHTAGEPARIIIKGFPSLVGETLLEKRAYAKVHCDSIRKKLMSEPRGHFDMYGAILVQDTELVRSGEADIGVLYCDNSGFSTMCGHATIALGRFLVETNDISIFPKRWLLKDSASDEHVKLTIHAPCGLVRVFVPVIPKKSRVLAPSPDSQLVRSDPSRPVSFFSVPSFATGVDIIAKIPRNYLWKELVSSPIREVRFDIAFGGAYYAIVTVDQLGFLPDMPIIDALQQKVYTLSSLKEATRLFKRFLIEGPKFQKYLRHPISPELEYLYGIIVVDPVSCNENRSSVGICFFADQQIDRSPCGSGVCARTALAVSKGKLPLHQTWTYNSLVTKMKGEGAFIGCAVEETKVDHDGRYMDKGMPWKAYIVEVSGYAYYTGVSTYVTEESDEIGREGFLL
ncbi:hypothetical protein Clacol_000347 [Clathrus columnatus]|uniref:trans-L-3-hydroxyproline dehydratase n=1 Tax=Clathrus columnatus TaxID=1419009 RepID=A0AAV4ZZ28_9AGAM|nr:hypothetical protein Clacol_000347 [Clathrus columnatus]